MKQINIAYLEERIKQLERNEEVNEEIRTTIWISLVVGALSFFAGYMIGKF